VGGQPFDYSSHLRHITGHIDAKDKKRYAKEEKCSYEVKERPGKNDEKALA